MAKAAGRTSGGTRAVTLRCSECGWQTTKWVGRCGECQAWGTVAEPAGTPGRTTEAGPVTEPARRIHEVDAELTQARPTGVDELDRVLGGGIVPGAVVLLAGEPGVGKSTLLLEVAACYASPTTPTLYVTGEESAGQVRMRAGRTSALDPHLYLAAETDLGAVLGHIDAVQPALLVVDSVQTIASADVDGSAGGVTQVREVAASLIRVAKTRGLPTILVGHVTKDGSIAGPRLLEHLVDVVLSFEGDRHSTLRMVRATKNRFGPADEVGCFELDDSGIRGLADPSGLFLSSALSSTVPGSCVTVTLEGRRPLAAELQALVVPSHSGSPRRATGGLDGSRVALLLAVLQQRCGLPLSNAEVYVSTVGGVRTTEPAVDLAAALALASAATNRPVRGGLVAVGEVGLAGEVRRVPSIARRLSEAARLGFTHALVPPDPGPLPEGIRVRTVATLDDALRAARISGPQ
ncbi:MAG TPA: DNA repair protein RadA [Candidatus Limnocylindria bacterium]|nr:DNA repair protein RadA [Candidatus Limnocylindria bacterium]